MFPGVLYQTMIGRKAAVRNAPATYMTESFETSIRGTAVGGSYNIGRIGAIMAPTAIGFIATQYSIGLGLVTMAVAYLLTGLIPAFFIREKMYDPSSRQPSHA